MPRYPIRETAEGYTLIKIEGRYYPMSLTLKEGGVPEVLPLLIDGQPISYVKRSTAASETWKHKAMLANRERECEYLPNNHICRYLAHAVCCQCHKRICHMDTRTVVNPLTQRETLYCPKCYEDHVSIWSHSQGGQHVQF